MNCPGPNEINRGARCRLSPTGPGQPGRVDGGLPMYRAAVGQFGMHTLWLRRELLPGSPADGNQNADVVVRLTWGTGGVAQSCEVDAGAGTVISIPLEALSAEPFFDRSDADTIPVDIAMGIVPGTFAGPHATRSFVRVAPSGVGALTLPVPAYATCVQVFAANAGALVDWTMHVIDTIGGQEIASWEATESPMALPPQAGQIVIDNNEAGDELLDVAFTLTL